MAGSISCLCRQKVRPGSQLLQPGLTQESKEGLARQGLRAEHQKVPLPERVCGGSHVRILLLIFACMGRGNNAMAGLARP